MCVYQCWFYVCRRLLYPYWFGVLAAVRTVFVTCLSLWLFSREILTIIDHTILHVCSKHLWNSYLWWCLSGMWNIKFWQDGHISSQLSRKMTLCKRIRKYWLISFSISTVHVRLAIESVIRNYYLLFQHTIR